jgi:hypothetical protein
MMKPALKKDSFGFCHSKEVERARGFVETSSEQTRINGKRLFVSVIQALNRIVSTHFKLETLVKAQQKSTPLDQKVSLLYYTLP